jgi:hypothetical protein
MTQRVGDVSRRAADVASWLPIALGLIDGEAGRYTELKRDLRSWAKRDPIDALAATVIGGGVAFYLAEREHNPACTTPWEGILYIATCLSVGYDNVFPTTPAGHGLAALVQSFGPALAGMAFDAPAAETRAEIDAARAETDAARADTAEVDRAILARLDDIVRLLGERAAP